MSLFLDVLNGVGVSELVSCLSLAACCLLGMVRYGHDGDAEPREDAEPDYSELESKIAALAQVSPRTPDQDFELANLYFAHAVQKQEYDELEEAILSYDNGIGLLSALGDADPRSEDSARLLGHALLSRAVAKNDLDDPENALLDYEKALKAFQPLADKQDGDAMYDIAGIRLNQGTIYHELGDYGKANEALDASFTAFRALEKISDMGDTRFYMAKVSIAMGSLYRDSGEPIEKIVDVYNRAMRLLVELIDTGQKEHEHELAVVLIDKCTARYEAYSQGQEPERTKKIDDVLVDVARGIEILRRLAEGGDPHVCFDLFNATMTQGTMLLDLGRNEAALSIFEELREAFSDLAEQDDPVVRYQYAAVEENRGVALFNSRQNDAAIEAFNRAVAIREEILDDEDIDPEDQVEFAIGLVSAYLNRAQSFGEKGDKASAKGDCDAAAEVIKPLADAYGEDFKEIVAQIAELREAMGP